MSLKRNNNITKLLSPECYVPSGLLFFLVLLPVLHGNPFYQNLIIMIFFYGTVASAWNLVGGFAGQIALGHTAFFGIGAYTSTLLYLKFGISPWLGLLAGAAVAMLVAAGIGIPCFRLKSHFFALATIAFAEVMRYIASFWRDLTEGGVGLLIPFKPKFGNLIFQSKLPYAYVALGFMLATILVSYLIRNSRFGFYLNGLRGDQDAAESLGVNTSRYKLFAFLISVFFTAAAGTFYAQYFLFIDPEIVFSLNFSIELALFSIIGGLGTVVGPVLGSFLLTPLDVLLRGWLGGISAGLNFIVYGIVLMVAVTYFPRGLAGWVKRWWKPLMRKLPRYVEREPEPIRTSPVLAFEASHLGPGSKDSLLFEVESISKSFGGLVAVKDVSFEIKKGEVLGLIGPNGAGKTTIFNLLTGFMPPDTGKVEFKGEAITGLQPPHKVCVKRIGRTFQLVKPFNDISVLENVMVGAFARTRHAKEAREEANRVLDFIGLSRQRDSLASSLTISYRKRLELGRALATKPELLLLDEVMAGLNPKEIEEIIEIVRSISNQRITIFMIEHVMKAIMTLSHRIIVLHHGEKIAEGTPTEVSKDKRVIEAYLGEEYLA